MIWRTITPHRKLAQWRGKGSFLSRHTTRGELKCIDVDTGALPFGSLDPTYGSVGATCPFNLHRSRQTAL